MPNIRSLVIVFGVKSAFESLTETIFVSCFHIKDMKVYAWSQVEGLDHYRWLQGPMTHLPY